MTTEQIPNSLYSPDGSKYGTLIGSGRGTKQLSGIEAPDGAMYLTLTDGAGNLI